MAAHDVPVDHVVVQQEGEVEDLDDGGEAVHRFLPDRIVRALCRLERLHRLEEQAGAQELAAPRVLCAPRPQIREVGPVGGACADPVVEEPVERLFDAGTRRRSGIDRHSVTIPMSARVTRNPTQ